jgi:hypothetical protein
MKNPVASSDDTWPDYTCATCGGDAGDSDNLGVIVTAGYGSTRYDTTSLIWTVRGEQVYPRGFICDDCIDRAVSEGHLEAFSSSIGGKDVGLNLSEAAYRELFAFGARRAYDAFWAHREDSPYQEAKEPSRLEQAVLTMRNNLSNDEVLSDSASLPRARVGWKAVDIGYAHAVAAIAFGCGESDPGFENASQTWAKARKALDEDLDLLQIQCKEAFGFG